MREAHNLHDLDSQPNLHPTTLLHNIEIIELRRVFHSANFLALLSISCRLVSCSSVHLDNPLIQINQICPLTDTGCIVALFEQTFQGNRRCNSTIQIRLRC